MFSKKTIPWTKYKMSQLRGIAKHFSLNIKKRKKAEFIEELKKAHLDFNEVQKIIMDSGTQASAPSKVRETSSKVRVSPSSGSSRIEKRFQNLESQIKYLMNKVSVLETKLVSPIHSHGNANQKVISKIILKKLSPGDSMSVDELKNISKLNRFPWQDIEHTILELVDDERLDVSEGASINKINGKIGRIIRR